MIDQLARVCLLVVPLLAALPVPAEEPTGVPGQEYTLAFDEPPHGLSKAAFELWIPDAAGEGKIRAVICMPLYQADRTIYVREDWRVLAARQKAAMLRHDMRATVAGRRNRLPVGRDAIGGMRDALGALAAKAGRPELAEAPLVLTGLSQGGWQTTRLTLLAPEQIVAALPFHGAALDEWDAAGPDALGVPMLIILGQMDNLTARIVPSLPEHLGRKGLSTVLLQPEVPHHKLGDQEYILLWLDAMMSARIDDEKPGRLRKLPRGDGRIGSLRIDRRWLVTDAGHVPAAGDEAAPSRATIGGVWLPSEKLADAWVTANLTGHVSEHETYEELAARCAPAPKAVKVDGKLDEWPSLPLDLTWSAQILPTGLNFHGENDYAAGMAVAHDKQFVYFAVRVADDETLYGGKAPWMQDGVEIRIDARPAPLRMANVGAGEGTDFLLLAVGPDPDKPFIHDEANLPEGTRIASTAGAEGYTVEIALPNAYLDEAQGGKWTRFRMNVAVDDFDAEGLSQLWWRPDWRTDQNNFGSGTVVRVMGEGAAAP